jgi:hypothetical protein
VQTDAGETLYCCKPYCRPYGPSTDCPSPSLTYWCQEPLTPSSYIDASLACETLWSADMLAQMYCCGPQDTCFPGPTDPYKCSTGQQYFCTGSATASMSGTACVAVAVEAGAGIRSYCCITADADAGDGG